MSNRALRASTSSPKSCAPSGKSRLISDIPALCRKVDGILLESVDGRVHLEQVKPVIAAHKPVFIDKPLAATLEDAREIARLAKEAGVPWFSASDLRFTGARPHALKFPDTTGAIAWGPGPLEPHHQLDLSWYAIHAVELLYTLMGPRLRRSHARLHARRRRGRRQLERRPPRHGACAAALRKIRRRGVPARRKGEPERSEASG